MNPDRNMQLSLASLGELRSTASPVRRLLVVAAQGRDCALFYRLLKAANKGVTHIFLDCLSWQAMNMQVLPRGKYNYFSITT